MSWLYIILDVFQFCNRSFNYALNFNSFSLTCSDGGDKCLPVNDILDVVMHTLVVSSSVRLDVKCNLGKRRDRTSC